MNECNTTNILDLNLLAHPNTSHLATFQQMEAVVGFRSSNGLSMWYGPFPWSDGKMAVVLQYYKPLGLFSKKRRPISPLL